MRQVYNNRLRLKRNLTQGSIISHCLAENYKCEIWGLIITPRCDLAHRGKVSNVHYIPIIDFDQWFKYDGKKYLYEKAYAKSVENLEKMCLEFGFPLNNMSEENMMRMAESMNCKSRRDSFVCKLKKYYELQKISPFDYEPTKDGKCSLIDNLIKNQISGFHLIEDWSDTRKFKIILLRDLKRLEYDVAIEMVNGVEESAISAINKNDLECSLSKDLIYEIKAEIASPYIEHIMERFSHNFCRVGVSDFENNTKELLLK